MGKTLEGSRIRQELGVIVLAIKGENTAMRFNPPPDEVIHAGDHLIVMGDPDGLRRLEDVGLGARMKITTAAEMREIDRASTEKFRCALAHPDGERRNCGGAVHPEEFQQRRPHCRRVRQGQQWRRRVRGGA